jgi:hypothetical protein
MRLHVSFVLLFFTLLSNSFSAENETVISLTLTADTLELAEGNTTSLHVNATYKDGTTRTSNSDLQWSIDNSSKIEISGTTLTALKEGTTALHVSQNSITSNPLHVTIYKEINGHRLPPKPDEALNNSTLLGIDINNNGVRDDVERYLLDKYKDHHPIISEIALQSGRAYQVVIQYPSKAKETVNILHAAKDCNYYFQDDADYFGDPILIDHKIMDDKFKDIQLNTKERMRAYLEYNHNLSGGVYRLTPSSKAKAQCDFNTTELLKIQP